MCTWMSCVCKCRCPQTPKEGTGFPEAIVIGNCELSNVGAETQTQVPLQEQYTLSITLQLYSIVV